MTETQSNRTKLKRWRDTLVSLGGTPLYNDTILMVLRRIATQLGIAINCCTQYTEYRLKVLIGLNLGIVTLPSTNLPPHVLEQDIWDWVEAPERRFVTDEDGRLLFYYDPDTGEKVYVTA